MSHPTSTPTHILLLGGSGRTGKLVIEEALRRAHAVTALVRNASSITPQHNLHLIQGSPLNKADLAKALVAITLVPDQRIVIVSTLSQTRASGNPWAAVTSPRRMMADAMENAIAAAKEDGRMEKLVVMSMFGAGESFHKLVFFMRWVMRWSNMDVTVDDHNLVDAVVKGSGLNFVMVRSAMLKGEEMLPLRELGDEGERAGWMPSVSRRSVAGMLVDAVEQSGWDRRTPVIAN
jgi:nucleoside-diphosphate-sugar epimerase